MQNLMSFWDARMWKDFPLLDRHSAPPSADQQFFAGYHPLFFFDFKDSRKQSLDGLARSLMVLLYSERPRARKDLDMLFCSCGNGSRQPATEALLATLQSMFQYAKHIWLIIDALDECRTRQDLLSWMRDISRPGDTNNIHLLTTSRAEEDIQT